MQEGRIPSLSDNVTLCEQSGKDITSLKSLTLEGKVKREKKSFWRVLDHYLSLDPSFLKKRKLGLELQISTFR